MLSVNRLQAKSSLSCLIDAIEQGNERKIIIARNGKPAAKLVLIETTAQGHRIGIAKGIFKVPNNIDRCNNEVVKLFSD